MSSFIVLAAKGEVKGSTLGQVAEGGVEAAISKALKRAKAPALIGSWSWQKYTLFLYGYKEGRKGTENTHDLLSPFDETVLYGDAVVIASMTKSPDSPTPFTPDHYKKFYNSKGGGDIADADEEDEEEEEDELDDDEEEEDYEEEEVGDDEEGAVDVGGMDDEEEEDVRPMLRIKSSSGFKKIAKWMHSPELSAEDYVL